MIFNVTGGGSGSGGTLVITAPAGVTCTVSKDGKTKVKTVDQYGYAIFKGLDTGTWTVTITDGSQTSPAYTVEIVADYAVTVSFFSATIAVTYPEGSTCTCSDGSTTLTAPDTSGSYTFQVPNAGEWTVNCTDGSDTDSMTVTIITDGQSESVTLNYTMYLLNYADTCDDITGGWNAYNANGTSVTRSISEAGMTIKGTRPSGTWGAMFGYSTANQVDVTKWSKMIATGGENSNKINVLLTPAVTNGSLISTRTVSISGGGTMEADLSEVTGSYYVVVCANLYQDGGTGTTTASVTCYTVSLE